MKFIYNLVTFLAALVVLSLAGLHLYLNANKIKPTLKALCPLIAGHSKQCKNHCSEKCICETKCVCEDCPNCKCDK